MPQISPRIGVRLRSAACVALALAVAGCAPVQKYRPIALSPTETASRLEARTLDDPGLRPFLEQSAGRSIDWPPKTWDLRLLTLAAFYFSPSLEAARARVAIAQAAVVTAGMRPNPSLTLSPGVPSPYLLGLELAIPVVTAGKRTYQVQAATNLDEGARLGLAETAWSVRSSVRTTLLDVLAADRGQDLLQTEVRLRAERLTRLGAELAAGEVARPAVDSARVDFLNSQLAESVAEGRVEEARAALAAAIGIPASGLGNARFGWPGIDQLPVLGPQSARQIQRDAVLNRLDVRQALLAYRAAEAVLQLEIARQHPNFELGPGYQYEERNSYFAPSLSVTLPLFNRNQGRIAEAEARRKQAADNLLATQARVIAESEQGLAQYRAAYAELRSAERVLANLRDVRLPAARRQVAAGETARLSLNAALLENSTAAETALNALFQAQSALGALEGAVQKPLEPGDRVPLVVPARLRMTNE